MQILLCSLSMLSSSNLPATTVPLLSMTFTHSSVSPNFMYFFNPQPNNRASKRHIIAPKIQPRNREIDFGKYKGKMLGTIPSRYLEWISRKFGSSDFGDWPKLADQVLEDPYYQDRLEWERAEIVLRGDRVSMFSRNKKDPVTQLNELSRRFGWDMEDREGWSKVKFNYLGTDKSGPIPRLGSSSSVRVEKEKELKVAKEERTEGLSESDERRRGRRERARMKRRAEITMEKMRIATKCEGSCVNSARGVNAERNEDERAEVKNNNFPGRETLLNNVRHRTRVS